MIGFDWFNEQGIKDVLNIVYKVINIIRIVVPIGLVVMTSLDVIKKVINPSEKEGQQKILYRAIAAIVVFFIPTIIKIIFNIADIDIDSLNNGINNNVNNNSSNNNTNNNNSNSNNNANTNNNLNVKIIDCPSSSKVFHEGDKIVLNSNLPSNYNNTIWWTLPSEDRNYVTLNPTGSSLSANVEIKKIVYDTTIDVSLTIYGGKSDTCEINVEKEKLSEVKILNCDSNKRYIVGDTVTFNTNIPASFKGDVKWKFDEDILMVKDDTKKDRIVFEIIKRPQNGFITPSVTAGGKASACTMKIASVNKLQINCPSENTVYHVGDKIHLSTNLPKTYNGTFKWYSTTTPDTFKINQINNGFEAELEVLKKPQYNNGFISLVADGDSASCQIKIE